MVTINRSPWDKYRPSATVDSSRANEMDRAFNDELVQYFKVNGKEVQKGRWTWNDCYYVITDDGSKLKVCQQAWIAISGITRGVIEYAQG